MAAYVDLPSLKQALKIGDTDDDPRLGLLVLRASRLIDRWTGRDDDAFIGRAQTRVYDVAAPASPDRGALGYESWSVTLDLDPVMAVTAVATDRDGDGTFETVWLPTDYTLLPINAAQKGRPYQQLRSHDWTSLGGQWLPSGQARLQVQGTFGEADASDPTFQTPPGPIVEATIATVSYLAKAPVDAPFGVIGNPEFGTQKVPPCPPVVTGILRDGGYMASQDFWFA